jgi:hypothetical protein
MQSIMKKTDNTETNIARLPLWVRREIANSAEEGGRNAQMIRIAPTLIRCGHSAKELHSLFDQMYKGAITNTEISSVLRSAVKYARRDVQSRDFETQLGKQLHQITCQAQRDFQIVLTKYRWPVADFVQPISEASPLHQTEDFLRVLFDPDDVIWIGMKHHSGKQCHRSRFRRVGDWLTSSRFGGEFCSHCTFKPDTYSRTNEAVQARKFLVVESDTLGRDEIGAVFRWLEVCGLQLRAIVDSGKRSLHGWFDYPGDNYLDEWLAILVGLNCDPATTRPSQPVRLPGIVRSSTKKLQCLLYIR